MRVATIRGSLLAHNSRQQNSLPNPSGAEPERVADSDDEEVRSMAATAIQGELGSFSHQAALKLTPGARIVPCSSSAEVFDKLTSGAVGVAVVPIENSLA